MTERLPSISQGQYGRSIGKGRCKRCRQNAMTRHLSDRVLEEYSLDRPAATLRSSKHRTALAEMEGGHSPCREMSDRG